MRDILDVFKQCYGVTHRARGEGSGFQSLSDISTKSLNLLSNSERACLVDGLCAS